MWKIRIFCSWPWPTLQYSRNTFIRLTCREDADLEFVKHHRINVLLHLKIKKTRLTEIESMWEKGRERERDCVCVCVKGSWFVQSTNILCSQTKQTAMHTKVLQNSAISYDHSCDQKKKHARANARQHALRSSETHLECKHILTPTHSLYSCGFRISKNFTKQKSSFEENTFLKWKNMQKTQSKVWW